MIEYNKIEEAAFDLYKNSKLDFVSSESVEGSKEGAKWMQEEFLKDLWHPASEEPKFGKGRLLVLINGSVSILNVGFVLDQLRNLHNIYGIEGWLYLDDLLPKEGGEKNERI